MSKITKINKKFKEQPMLPKKKKKKKPITNVYVVTNCEDAK
jgi:hypothetical protein